jgi:amino acid adenylation domain-containing protein
MIASEHITDPSSKQHQDLQLAAIETSYPLSPAQQGMLFNCLFKPLSGMYVRQIILTLREEINVSALQQAWQLVVKRHPGLRISIRWEGLSEPLQDVHRAVEVPFEEHDWRGLAADEQHSRFESLIESERKSGFDFSQSPMLRLKLVREANATYQMAWTFHHIVADGHSQTLILKEVFTFYEAICQRKKVESALTPAYRDYVAWLQQQDTSKAEAYWQEYLEGLQSPTSLPFHETNNSVETHQPSLQGIQSLTLPKTLTSALQAFACQHRITLNTLLQGAWSLLLHRYTGEEDIVFGAVKSSRRSAPGGRVNDSVVGLYVNILPVRVRFSPDLRVLPWLKSLRAEWLAMRGHEHLPPLKIHSCSGLPYSVALFKSLLIFNASGMTSRLRQRDEAWEKREVRDISASTNYPLELFIDAEELLTLTCKFDLAFFDDLTARRMLGHIQTLLEGIVANPELTISQLPLLTAPERHQLLVEWNNTKKEDASEACIHQLFEAQVDRDPDAVAVAFDEERVSYNELNQRANRLAHYLRSRGVGPEVRVAIMMPRSIEMIVGLLAILKAGGVYIPLDPQYPQERLAFMFADTAASIVVTQASMLGRLQEEQAELLCVDKDQSLFALQNIENLESLAQPDNLAYVIYTSGSTGRPKGVSITHRSALTLLHWSREVFSQAELSGVLAATSICFDLSIFELFAPLSWGGTVILAEDILHLSGLPAANQVTLINTVPSAMTELVRDGLVPESVRTVNLAGEALQNTLVQRIYEQPTIKRVINLYGPSEDTTYSTMAEMAKGSCGIPTIGRPIANTETYVLDRTLEAVPIEVAGELYIGGAGLARGYLHRPELTAERFIPDPFSGRAGARLYHTGDLARYQADGEIEFLGRVDHQVKLRGYRIELGEIEAALGRHEQVSEVVVVARGGAASEEQRLVGYVVRQPGSGVSSRELREYLKQSLPDYMIPAALVLLEQMPLTANGKVDRSALPEAELGRGALSEGYVAARTPEEEMLAGIWREVLGVEQVGVHDNFFELGGHSLKATQLISRVRKALNFKMGLRQIFETPTLAGLTEQLLKDEAVSGHFALIAQLKKKIEKMSAEEIRSVLQNKKQARG